MEGDIPTGSSKCYTPIVGRDRLNRYVDTYINMFLSASSCGPFFLDNENDFAKTVTIMSINTPLISKGSFIH